MSTALVVGLGRSGAAAATLLVRRGWRVIAVDANPVDAPELVAMGVDVRGSTVDPVPDIALVVKSPGVPGETAQVLAARAAGAEIVSEIELAARELANPIIAVTGTNGKTTTTELAAHLLRAAGRPAIACGNQGLPLASLVDVVDPATWLVVECSSFQLEDVDRFHPRAAVVLNLTPDHLDRHGSMDAYRTAKLRVFAAMTADDLAIAPEGWAIPGGAVPRVIRQGARRSDADIAWTDGGLHVQGLGRIAGWDAVPLRGRHNRENVMAAAALVAHAAQLTGQEIAAGLASFAGVAHRLEIVAELDGVTYVNDSKATNADAACAALDAYPHGVHLIAGGKPKGAVICAAGRCRPGRRRALCLSDRCRGSGDRRRDARGRCADPRRGHARRCRRRREQRCPPRRGGAVGARLCELRPIHQFRGARRAFPRVGRGTRTDDGPAAYLAGRARASVSDRAAGTERGHGLGA